MNSNSQTAKDLKDLASKVLDVVVMNSAGDSSRWRNWNYFVRNLPSDHTLMELTLECVNAMSDDQRQRLLVNLDRKSAS